jgi:hypothetical protein
MEFCSAMVAASAVAGESSWVDHVFALRNSAGVKLGKNLSLRRCGQESLYKTRQRAASGDGRYRFRHGTKSRRRKGKISNLRVCEPQIFNAPLVREVIRLEFAGLVR